MILANVIAAFGGSLAVAFVGPVPAASPFVFYALAGIAMIGGILVITRRNPVHSAIALIVTLLAAAGLSVMLFAPFVAGVQIVVYAGGVMALFLVVIMLTVVGRSGASTVLQSTLNSPFNQRRFNRIWPMGLAAGGALLALLVSALVKGRALFSDRMISLPDSSNTQQIATMLYGEAGRLGEYTFAFEIASLLLLVAVLGAVIMARKKS